MSRFHKVYLIFCFSLLFFHQGIAQQRHIFSIYKTNFLLDGKPFQIISGEMHPARIPEAYWRQRIKMAKAMGCNTIAVYIFWNYHETKEGIFDFTTANKNIAKFIHICQQEGLWVMVRPGPYVCGEWDWGGLPTYLLKKPDIKIRCMDSTYMAAIARYVTHVSKELKPLLCSNGGPVILTQVENEYGSFGNDRNYLHNLKSLWENSGINGPFYTADGATPYMLDAGSLENVAIGLDPGVTDEDFATAAKHNSNVPLFSSETYPGWLTHWGEEWQRPDTNKLKTDMEYLLSKGKSFNLYVIHGGTNFGFTAGANAFSPTQFQPDITSYDYDAPINEQGKATPKYYMLRNLISKYVKYPIPDVPAPIKTIHIPAFKTTEYTTIWQQLQHPIATPQPKPMEYYNQNQGLILYRTELVGHKSGTLTITEPHDFAMVFVDGKLIDTIYRDGGKWSIQLPETKSAHRNPQLDILVEGMGHINFAQYMIDRKGITDRVTLDGMTLMNWQTYLLPLDEKFITALKAPPIVGKAKEEFPVIGGKFFKGTFTLNEIGDTYFDMSNYSRGIVYVNHHNLGRYWHIGPQHSLYCPSSWLKKGENEIIIFDLLQTTPATIEGIEKLK